MFGIPLIIIISSIVMGIYFPSYGKEISPIIPILQSILIFLSTIKVDFKIYKKYAELLKPFLLGFFTCYTFIPILFFLVGLFLLKIDIINFPLFVGIIITGVVPLAAGSTLVWSKELGGKVEITLLLIVTTILASPIITPTYIYLFLKDEISVNTERMFIEMALIIFIPVLISILVKNKLKKNLNSNISFLVMGIIIYIAVSKSVERLDLVKGYLFNSILLSLVFIIITLLFLALTSNILKLNNEEKESIFIPSFFKNISLAIIVVSFFEPEVVFFPVVYYIIEQLFSPLYYEIKNKNLLVNYLK
ncbi:MAG: Sodium Bile acid symporter family protein [Candidatus Methanofastidiosum methylothiophilum]|uniref:Sodium Bile acid symporter family protein n=1 Tax=Candidatus Methanofastidiosum methylothiophilum TaxID=1705564 RepID=A0A150IUY7_9EURY|nr:MAG: Sodium Bile acid symporter family protein [Candidatus Methanofastidiosum methylthiophilus]